MFNIRKIHNQVLVATTGIALYSLVAVPIHAALVVNYDLDTYGTGALAARSSTNLDIDGDSLVDDSRATRAFTDVGGASWSTGASYTGPTLYGGFVGEALNRTNFAGDDYTLTPFAIRYQTTTTGQSGRLHIIALFDANQPFPLKFDTGATGTSYLNIARNGNANLERFESLGDVRWVVRNGSTLYVSQTTIANTNAASRTLDATELASEMWAVYNPTDAFTFNLSLNFNTPTSALTNLNAFGVMTYKDTFSAVRSWLKFEEFKVDAVPVPEPASLALLGLGSLLMLPRRAKKKA